MRGIVFEFLHARTEPLVGIVVIVRDARAKNIQEGETRMLDTLLDQLGEVFLLTAESSRDEGGPCGQCQRNRIHRSFDVTERHALGFHADAAGWRRLARGEAIRSEEHTSELQS